MSGHFANIVTRESTPPEHVQLKKNKIELERLSKNLMNWPEITAFSLELRKSFLKSKYSDMDEDDLIKKIFSEIVDLKEKMGVKETLTDQLKI